MAKKNSDTLLKRREFVYTKALVLLGTRGFKSIKETLQYIADEMLFLDYTTVYRDYTAYINLKRAQNL